MACLKAPQSSSYLKADRYFADAQLIRAATIEKAAACQMVVLAVPWDRVAETLASLPRWKSQILIDAANPFHGKAGSFTPAEVGNLSTSQLVAALARGAREVKALNTLRASLVRLCRDRSRKPSRWRVDSAGRRSFGRSGTLRGGSAEIGLENRFDIASKTAQYWRFSMSCVSNTVASVMFSMRTGMKGNPCQTWEGH